MVACYMYLYGHLFTVLAYVEALTISSLLALCYGFFLCMGFSFVWVFPLYGFFLCLHSVDWLHHECPSMFSSICSCFYDHHFSLNNSQQSLLHNSPARALTQKASFLGLISHPGLITDQWLSL